MPKIPACQSGKGSVPWGTRTQRGFGMTGLFQVRLDGHFLISRVLWVEFQVKSSSATTVRLRLQVAGWLLPANTRLVSYRVFSEGIVPRTRKSMPAS